MTSKSNEPKRGNYRFDETEKASRGKPSDSHTKMDSPSAPKGFKSWGPVVWPIHKLFCLIAILFSIVQAYGIRLYAVHTYGMVIHEFDPWFNFRASQYLSDHGWTAFFEWYDYMSWYPLGRPVGTTIYPGLQITSVFIHEALKMCGVSMSLNDVCVMIPAWFGAVSTLLLAFLAYEATRSLTAATIAAYLFSILPAHLMRSMAGEYDNECIAMAAMLLTFYMWVRSLRSPRSWPIGFLAGVAYGYMVSTWGGYIFVLNMVAVHAGTCVLVDWACNRYDASLLKAYTLFFVVGTALATRVPPVGSAPFRSLEQIMPLLLFVFMWALHFSERVRHRADVEVHSTKALQIRSRFFTFTVAALVVVAVVLAPTGYFGPLSSRVRALFVQHTRTGNPLVDSVAEHQPSTMDAYWAYLHVCYLWWGVGFAYVFMVNFFATRPARTFVIVYSMVAYYFSAKMSRLLLLSGPVAVVMTSAVIGSIFDSALSMIAGESARKNVTERPPPGKRNQKNSKEVESKFSIVTQWNKFSRERPKLFLGVLLVLLAVSGVSLFGMGFYSHCVYFSHGVGQPQHMFQAKIGRGELIMVDDYYMSYIWLRDNTPEDARILAWWDYGYQITGIGNRTTLADGNTWNHEHIATIGKMFASPVKESHTLIRHLADYVLIWAGQSSGDLLKSPHMARIGNSVYRDICPEDDPLCANFGFYNHDLNSPTPMMRRSLLYNLNGDGSVPGVSVDRKLFRPVYISKYGLVKIFRVMNVSRESKAWVADPKNRKCDSPGSWICPGQYPPAKEIQDLLAKRIDYGQLEDFNKGKKDDAYYRAYMRRSGMEH